MFASFIFPSAYKTVYKQFSDSANIYGGAETNNEFLGELAPSYVSASVASHHLVSTSIDANAAIITAHLPPHTPSAVSIYNSEITTAASI